MLRRTLFQEKVNELIGVSSPVIMQAKRYLTSLNEVSVETEKALTEFLRINGKDSSDTITFTDSPTQLQIEQTAERLSFSYAFCEAVWALIHSGYFIETLDPQSYYLTPQFKLHHVHNNGSNMEQISFNGMSSPRFLIIAPSKRNRTSEEFVLFDPELYASRIGNNLHSEVQSALEDTIRCFLMELYRPAVTLLGKAVEGAWVELGIALYSYADEQVNDAEKQIDRLKNETNFMKRIQSVTRLFEKQEIFGVVSNNSGVRLNHLREISIWSDVIRDSRNAIHFGVDSILPNNYEKVAVLLMSAASHLKTLYALKAQADLAQE